MGVYIKGFRKPTYCQECPLTFDFDCMIQHEQRDSLIDQYKHCPIVEVTEPHGRLIDESQIKTVYGEAMTTRYQGYISRTEKITHTDAPTIIEAEGE